MERTQVRRRGKAKLGGAGSKEKDKKKKTKKKRKKMKKTTTKNEIVDRRRRKSRDPEVVWSRKRVPRSSSGEDGLAEYEEHERSPRNPAEERRGQRNRPFRPGHARAGPARRGERERTRARKK